jgi:endosialidase-like protein
MQSTSNLNRRNETKNMTILHLRKSISRSPLRLGFLLIPLALAWFALLTSPNAFAVLPAPDGGYPNDNTAEGEDALFSLTSGPNNTAIGFDALFSNTEGDSNTATGKEALFSNTTGNFNTANGPQALYSNTTGNANTANGDSALFNNTIGSGNTANGNNALLNNTTGSGNTANGDHALSNATGGGNIALGFEAGQNLTTGNSNIDIGSTGVAGDARKIRIGVQGTQNGTFIAGISGAIVPGGIGVIVGTNGKLGTVVSSARFKDQIKPMDKASEAILALKPVTFRYKQEIDPESIPQFGLVAEEVEKINPDLVVRDPDGKAYTVRYEAVNAMLLNEFLKEHRTVEVQQATIAQLKAADAKQEEKISALTAMVKAQAAQIQKVSAQLAVASPSYGGLELSKTAPQMVANGQ